MTARPAEHERAGALGDGARPDLLTPILDRKRREVARRRAHLGLFDPRGPVSEDAEDRRPAVLAALRRGEGPVRVIAEVKFRSPSAGVIRTWSAGEGVRIAEAYVTAGAAAVSVLCDRAGFGGSPLALRRIARAVEAPVLFKEFVLDELQLDLARRVGASMVLLLVRALNDEALAALVRGCLRRGLEPVVEAADAAEVDRALSTEARVIGVNARDLSTFRVDPQAAAQAIGKVPPSRVAVYMSGVSTPEELARLTQTRTDAVLVGSALMKADSPGRRLTELTSLATKTGPRTP